jgi:predicted small integral membrane protein
MLLVVALWFIFSRSHGGGSSPASGAMSKAIQEFLALQFHPGALRTVATYLKSVPLDLSHWGLFFPACALLLVWGWKSLRPRSEPRSLALVLTFLGTFAATAFIFYIGSFNSEGLGGWMGRSFPREFFPSMVLLGILAVMAAGRAERPSAEPSAAV